MSRGLKDYVAGHDVRGDFIFPDGRTTEIKYSVVPYQGSTTIFMKTSNGWFPWEHTRVVGDTVVFSYDYWYCPPASREDLRIFDLSLSYLKGRGEVADGRTTGNARTTRLRAS